jgi:hypothetical protein
VCGCCQHIHGNLCQHSLGGSVHVSSFQTTRSHITHSSRKWLGRLIIHLHPQSLLHSYLLQMVELSCPPSPYPLGPHHPQMLIITVQCLFWGLTTLSRPEEPSLHIILRVVIMELPTGVISTTPCLQFHPGIRIILHSTSNEQMHGEGVRPSSR